MNASTIAKNAGFLFVSQMITWALTLALTVVQPRYLGPAAFGDLRFTFSLWMVLGVLIGCGTDVLIVKEVARERSKAPSLLGTSLVLRLALFAVCALGVAAYLWYIQATPQVVTLTAVVGVATLVAQMGLAAESALRGLELMDGVSISTIASKLINTLVGIGLLVVGFGEIAVGVAYLGSSLVALATALLFLRRSAGMLPEPKPASSISLMRSGAPYLLIGASMALYGSIDTLVMHRLVAPDVLGWYSVAVTLTGTLLFLPVILSSAVFPAMVRTHAAGSSDASLIIRKGFDMMLLVAVPIGMGMAVVSTPIITLIFGAAFAPAGPVLAVMGGVLILFFMNILLAQYLISINRQNLWTMLTLGAAGSTVLLDLALVPLFQDRYGNGAIGGAVSYLITEGVMFVVAVLSVPRGTLVRANAWSSLRTLLAGALMVAACWLARDLMLGVVMAIGGLTYVAAVAALRIVPQEDVRFLREMARRAVGRVRSRVSKPLGTEGAV